MQEHKILISQKKIKSNKTEQLFDLGSETFVVNLNEKNIFIC